MTIMICFHSYDRNVGAGSAQRMDGRTNVRKIESGTIDASTELGAMKAKDLAFLDFEVMVGCVAHRTAKVAAYDRFWMSRPIMATLEINRPLCPALIPSSVIKVQALANCPPKFNQDIVSAGRCTSASGQKKMVKLES